MITERMLRDHPALVKALMGIPAELFWELVDTMSQPGAPAEPDSAPSTRAGRPGRPYAHGLAQRLAAVCTYLRLHLPQTVVGMLFGVGQEDVSRDLRRIVPVLQPCLPCPVVWAADPPASAEPPTPLALALFSQQRALVDATEQVVQRPQDALQRTRYYSGKKKAFTLKTQLVSDAAHHIRAISTAVPGAVHDKALAEQVRTLERLPADTEALLDKGYQGLAKQVPLLTIVDPVHGAVGQVPRVRILTPIKQRPGQELPPDQVAFNQALSSLRIRVEHDIGWIKNWRIVATRFRCAHDIYTSLLQIVCGFVNVQTDRWQAAKAKDGNCA
jgi:hypothetical protein